MDWLLVFIDFFCIYFTMIVRALVPARTMYLLREGSSKFTEFSLAIVLKIFLPNKLNTTMLAPLSTLEIETVRPVTDISIAGAFVMTGDFGCSIFFSSADLASFGMNVNPGMDPILNEMPSSSLFLDDLT